MIRQLFLPFSTASCYTFNHKSFFPLRRPYLRFDIKKYRTGLIIFLSLSLSIIFLFFLPRLPSVKNIFQWRIYDILQKTELRLICHTRGINDIVLVTIDNETIKNMDKKWPYSRPIFAQAIRNLKEAQPKIIAFDFIFYGTSQNGNEGDDVQLKASLQDGTKVIFGAPIDEEGQINTSSSQAISGNISYGIATKLQDFDEVTRRGLTYLVGKENDKACFLSFEMQLLKNIRDIDISTLRADKDIVSFSNKSGENWAVPVDPDTKSFLINFRANTRDFKRVSFYKILRGDFDTRRIKDKIVIIGLLSSLLGDFHNTAIGWLPGITLNANSFLTIYSHNFLKTLPDNIERLFVLIWTLIASFFIAKLNTKKVFLVIIANISAFFLLSLFLLTIGYIWDYFTLLCCIVLPPILSIKAYDNLFLPAIKKYGILNNDVV